MQLTDSRAFSLSPPLSPDGTPSFPSIRPLETLHNSLSLQHLDEFLQRVTQPQVLKLDHDLEMRFNLDTLGAQFENQLQSKKDSIASSTAFLNADIDYGNLGDMISPSSSTAWSGSPSFVSSSGPASPVWSATDLSTNRQTYVFEIDDIQVSPSPQEHSQSN